MKNYIYRTYDWETKTFKVLDYNPDILPPSKPKTLEEEKEYIEGFLNNARFIDYPRKRDREEIAEKEKRLAEIEKILAEKN